MCILFKYVRSFLGPGNTNTIHTDLLGLFKQRAVPFLLPSNKQSKYWISNVPPPSSFSWTILLFFFIFIVFSTLTLCLTFTLHFHQYNLHTKKLKSTLVFSTLRLRAARTEFWKGEVKAHLFRTFWSKWLLPTIFHSYFDSKIYMSFQFTKNSQKPTPFDFVCHHFRSMAPQVRLQPERRLVTTVK